MSTVSGSDKSIREPFGYFCYDMRFDAWVQNKEDTKGIAFYTAPPQHEWQGLTDDEYETMAEDYVTNCYFNTLKYAKAIEQALKDKNT